MSENNKKFISLGTRITVVMLLAAVIAVGLFFGLKRIGGFLVWKYYMDPESVEDRKTQYLSDFQTYVRKHKIRASDSEVLREAAINWSSYKSASIVLYVNDDLICSEDWFDIKPGADTGSYDDIINGDRGFKQYLTEEARSKYEALLASISEGDSGKKPVEFQDGTVFATIIDQSGDMANNFVAFICALTAALLFLAIVINYVMLTVSRISTLAKNVRQIENGDMERAIVVSGNDEISSLASDVESMKNAILENERKEYEAWKSNADLITAMSHDIRTPLTVMIGYIDLLELQNKDPALDDYIATCRSNAVRLKLLSDDLFQYNLAFGNGKFEVNAEVCNIAGIIDHMINEYVMLCEKSGYSFEFVGKCPERSVRIDTSYFGRVIGNLFSNIQKYADKSSPITIEFVEKNNYIEVIFKNKILSVTQKAESNKIGNKTCEKIMQALGGEFRFEINEDKYIATVVIRADLQNIETHRKG